MAAVAVAVDIRDASSLIRGQEASRGQGAPSEGDSVPNSLQGNRDRIPRASLSLSLRDMASRASLHTLPRHSLGNTVPILDQVPGLVLGTPVNLTPHIPALTSTSASRGLLPTAPAGEKMVLAVGPSSQYQ